MLSSSLIKLSLTVNAARQENKSVLSMAQYAKPKSEPAKIIIQKISKLGEKKKKFAYAMHQTITMKFHFQKTNVWYNDLLKVLILNTKKERISNCSSDIKKSL